ncbi:hypothetical protein ACFL4A_01065 [bacterium]
MTTGDNFTLSFRSLFTRQDGRDQLLEEINTKLLNTGGPEMLEEFYKRIKKHYMKEYKQNVSYNVNKANSKITVFLEVDNSCFKQIFQEEEQLLPLFKLFKLVGLGKAISFTRQIAKLTLYKRINTVDDMLVPRELKPGLELVKGIINDDKLYGAVQDFVVHTRLEETKSLSDEYLVAKMILESYMAPNLVDYENLTQENINKLTKIINGIFDFCANDNISDENKNILVSIISKMLETVRLKKQEEVFFVIDKTLQAAGDPGQKEDDDEYDDGYDSITYYNYWSEPKVRGYYEKLLSGETKIRGYGNFSSILDCILGCAGKGQFSEDKNKLLEKILIDFQRFDRNVKAKTSSENISIESGATGSFRDVFYSCDFHFFVPLKLENQKLLIEYAIDGYLRNPEQYAKVLVYALLTLNKGVEDREAELRQRLIQAMKNELKEPHSLLRNEFQKALESIPHYGLRGKRNAGLDIYFEALLGLYCPDMAEMKIGLENRDEQALSSISQKFYRQIVFGQAKSKKEKIKTLKEIVRDIQLRMSQMLGKKHSDKIEDLHNLLNPSFSFLNFGNETIRELIDSFTELDDVEVEKTIRELSEILNYQRILPEEAKKFLKAVEPIITSYYDVSAYTAVLFTYIDYIGMQKYIKASDNFHRIAHYLLQRKNKNVFFDSLAEFFSIFNFEFGSHSSHQGILVSAIDNKKTLLNFMRERIHSSAGRANVNMVKQVIAIAYGIAAGQDQAHAIRALFGKTISAYGSNVQEDENVFADTKVVQSDETLSAIGGVLDVLFNQEGLQDALDKWTVEGYKSFLESKSLSDILPKDVYTQIQGEFCLGDLFDYPEQYEQGSSSCLLNYFSLAQEENSFKLKKHNQDSFITIESENKDHFQRELENILTTVRLLKLYFVLKDLYLIGGSLDSLYLMGAKEYNKDSYGIRQRIISDFDDEKVGFGSYIDGLLKTKDYNQLKQVLNELIEHQKSLKQEYSSPGSYSFTDVRGNHDVSSRPQTDYTVSSANMGVYRQAVIIEKILAIILRKMKDTEDSTLLQMALYYCSKSLEIAGWLKKQSTEFVSFGPNEMKEVIDNFRQEIIDLQDKMRSSTGYFVEMMLEKGFKVEDAKKVYGGLLGAFFEKHESLSLFKNMLEKGEQELSSVPSPKRRPAHICPRQDTTFLDKHLQACK